MSFRRRNVALSTGPGRDPSGPRPNDPAATATNPLAPAKHEQQQLPGVRPSPIDGRLTTSTGTPSLDNLLAGHGGLALGSSLLIEECGTTDFAGALLRHYAAEGVVQGQRVHVVGVGEGWGRTLPGLIGTAQEGNGEERKAEREKMKIAWRYERLGDFGNGVAGSRGMCDCWLENKRVPCSNRLIWRKQHRRTKPSRRTPRARTRISSATPLIWRND